MYIQIYITTLGLETFLIYVCTIFERELNLLVALPGESISKGDGGDGGHREGETVRGHP